MNLLLTTMIGPPGTAEWRGIGKISICSMLRHLWDGEMRVLTSSEQPLFPVGRPGVIETRVDPGFIPARPVHPWRRKARQLLVEALGEVEAASDFQWILMADADCVALRNLDHLFAGSAELLVAGSLAEPDPGFLAVRGDRGGELARELKAAGGLSQEGLRRVIESGNWRTAAFERGEVVRAKDATAADILEAAVVHCGGMKREHKRRLMFGLHMAAVYGSGDGLFLEMLEA